MSWTPKKTIVALAAAVSVAVAVDVSAPRLLADAKQEFDSVETLEVLRRVDSEQCYGWMFGGAPQPGEAERAVFAGREKELNDSVLGVISGATISLYRGVLALEPKSAGNVLRLMYSAVAAQPAN